MDLYLENYSNQLAYKIIIESMQKSYLLQTKNIETEQARKSPTPTLAQPKKRKIGQ